MELTSSAFRQGEKIPDRYTCKGDNVSPALTWAGAPKETQSFALIVEDPDAPNGTYTHWVAFNIPENKMNLSENAHDGFHEGRNDFGNTGYGGPCPPRGHGRHRYFFKLFALDTTLNLSNGASKADLQNAMKGHVLDESELVGLYEVK